MKTNQFLLLAALVALQLTALVISETGPSGEKTDTKTGSQKYPGPIIGIDLGTTFSCVGIYKSGQVEIIANELGSRIVPSYIAFTDKERLVGDAAKNQAPENPTRTIFDVKRLIGRRFNEPTVQHDIKSFPFKVIDKDGKPYVRVVHQENEKDFACEELSALVLKKMKDIAEAHLGKKVERAVVTVPAYFNDAQRSATKAAGQIAGLEVVRIINEPTAAAIAYGFEKMAENNDKKILVYDLGGGTFDVSVLSLTGGVFEVIATNGDTHLGGEDFDQRVSNHFVKLTLQKTGKDLSKDKRAYLKLKHEVEKAKITLSSSHSAKIEIENLLPGLNFSETLTRARFEDLNKDLFQKTIGPVDRVLSDAKLKKNEIDEIIMVGGSTRIPKVRQLLTDYFNGKELHTRINPDEAVAYGAAVQGGVLTIGEGADVVLLDITPLTLGTEDDDGVMVKVIDRNTAIPTKKSQVFTTVVDNQPSVLFRVYEGERSIARFNHLLGEFSLKVPPAPRGVPEIRVTFEIDVNGILHVSAKDVASGNSESITINQNNNRLSDSQIKNMIEDSAKAEEQDRKYLERVEARKELEEYALSVKHSVTDLGEKISKDEKKKILNACNKALTYVRTHKKSEASSYQQKKDDLEAIVSPIMTKLYNKNKKSLSDTETPSGKKSPSTASDHEDASSSLHKESAKSGAYDADLDKVVPEQASGKKEKKDEL